MDPDLALILVGVVGVVIGFGFGVLWRERDV